MTNCNFTSETDFTPHEAANLLGMEVCFIEDKPLFMGGQDISALLKKPCFEWRKGDVAKVTLIEKWEHRIILNLVMPDGDLCEIDKQTFRKVLKIVNQDTHEIGHRNIQ